MRSFLHTHRGRAGGKGRQLGSSHITRPHRRSGRTRESLLRRTRRTRRRTRRWTRRRRTRQRPRKRTRQRPRQRARQLLPRQQPEPRRLRQRCAPVVTLTRAATTGKPAGSRTSTGHTSSRRSQRAETLSTRPRAAYRPSTGTARRRTSARPARSARPYTHGNPKNSGCAVHSIPVPAHTSTLDASRGQRTGYSTRSTTPNFPQPAVQRSAEVH